MNILNLRSFKSIELIISGNKIGELYSYFLFIFIHSVIHLLW